LIYSNAQVEMRQASDKKTHQLVLSAPKRINNAPFIENERMIEGDKHVLLLRLGASDSIADAFAYYEELIEKSGSLEFRCEKRACGINSYWANSILDERR